jgi:excinuclease ABC subunit C
MPTMETQLYIPAETQLFPQQPGVYFFYNKAQQVIYVGKAKNIKKRVSSYFNKKQGENLKTQKLVAEIEAIRFTIVNSEYEALLLENNLIKNLQPRYNMLLKDDKTFPYLCITNEPFPRIFPIRQKVEDGREYYGPFTDSKTMYQILELMHDLYPIRSCSYNLTASSIDQQKFKVCLEYHIGRCKGPCEGRQGAAAYQQDIAQIRHLLKGHVSTVQKAFREKMNQAAQTQDYKNAQRYKEKIMALTNYHAKALVAHPSLGEIDVLALISNQKAAFVSYLQIREGAITFTQGTTFKKVLEELDEEVLPLLILQFREKYASTAPEILINKPISTYFKNLIVTIPKIGDKKKLLDLAVKNAFFLQKEALHRQEESQNHAPKALSLLQEALHLKELPLHIECFDNSNLQGKHAVAAVVVFKNGVSYKKAYRHFHIKTVVGADDFSSMREIVSRRYKRILDEGAPLPQLIIIDGGKGQLNAAIESLQALGLYGKIAIIGIAKRLEEIYCPGDQYPLHISKQSPALKLLQQIRNEAHRFAISFHRKKRSTASLQSQLEGIPGVGEKTITKLLAHFGSIAQVKQATIETLEAHVGAQKAAALKAHLQ